MQAPLLRLLALLATLAVVSGCASSVEARPPGAKRSVPTAGQAVLAGNASPSAAGGAAAVRGTSTPGESTPDAPGKPGTDHLATELVIRSLALLGVQYRFGGTSPETGLDCSGLVWYVFREALGLMLPRRSEDMSRTGQAVAADELRPGDLVFFNTLRRAFSHVGIYIGNNQFVHAPSRGGQVRVENIDKRYWQSRFNGGRRLAIDGAAGATTVPAGIGASATQPSRLMN